MAVNPYNRETLKRFRQMGRHYWKVEIWNPYAKNSGGFPGVRQDCFGFIDYIIIDPIDGVVAVQITSPSSWSEHKKKILRNDYAARWVNFCKIELWTWRQLVKKGLTKAGKKRKGKVWTPRTETITIDMFTEGTKYQTVPTDNS